MKYLPILLLIACLACGCEQEAREDEATTRPAEANNSLAAFLLNSSPICIPAADGTIYAAVSFDETTAQWLWLVKGKSVVIRAAGLEPSDEDKWACDPYGGVYVIGRNRAWYFKDGTARVVQHVELGDVKAGDHKVTPVLQRWAAANQHAQQIEAATAAEAYDRGFEEGILDTDVLDDPGVNPYGPP